MRASLGKTSKESDSRFSTLAATSLALLTLAVTPAAASEIHPMARLTAPLPAVHQILGNARTFTRPDARLPESITTSPRMTYLVRPGNTLSGIAGAYLGSPGRWPLVWDANRSLVTNPNLIQPGWSLVVPTSTVALAVTVVAPDPAPVAPRLVPQRPTRSRHATPVTKGHATPVTRVSAGGYGGFQACVIRRESGGNPRAVNPRSGAGGLYQFLPSTWHSLGFSGLPENAPVSEQDAAFAKEFAESGVAAWRPYDGC